jgi:signal transduction histidine kinase
MIYEREWTSMEVDVIRIAAGVLGAAIKRQADEAALQKELNERRLLIDELESKNAELERFTYTVSHDLKSPIITIRGYLGFIEKDLKANDQERLHTDIKRIGEATERMQRLLNELLELSRIGRLMNPPVDIPFGQLVSEALENLHGQLTEQNVKLIVQPDMPVVTVDQIRLVEVLQNLIGNAANFMGNQPNPQIEIFQAGTEEDKYIFCVRDNGIGIPSEQFDRIFGLFNKLNPDGEGTGVGLALVKRIIEIHGGRIWVESELGKGSAFYFTLRKELDLT